MNLEPLRDREYRLEIKLRCKSVWKPSIQKSSINLKTKKNSRSFDWLSFNSVGKYEEIRTFSNYRKKIFFSILKNFPILNMFNVSQLKKKKTYCMYEYTKKCSFWNDVQKIITLIFKYSRKLEIRSRPV